MLYKPVKTKSISNLIKYSESMPGWSVFNNRVIAGVAQHEASFGWYQFMST